MPYFGVFWKLFLLAGAIEESTKPLLEIISNFAFYLYHLWLEMFDDQAKNFFF